MASKPVTIVFAVLLLAGTLVAPFFIWASFGIAAGVWTLSVSVWCLALVAAYTKLDKNLDKLKEETEKQSQFMAKEESLTTYTDYVAGTFNKITEAVSSKGK